MENFKRKKDYDYFDFFVDSAAFACQAAAFLQSALKDFDAENLTTLVKDMHKIEHDADSIKHDMLRNLGHEFMTPIEREDIVALAQQLDNVTDAIEDVVQRLYMYDVTVMRSDVDEFTALIDSCAKALLVTVKEFKNFKKSKDIVANIVKVNSIESEGDALYVRCTRTLFSEDVGTKELITWMTLYDCLEKCLDACEDASDIIESVVMKNT